MPRGRTARKRRSGGITYRDAGVDIATGDRFARQILRWMTATERKRVIPNPGGFAGLYRAGAMGIRKPVLVSGTDSVGTKLKVAFLLGRHETVGIDLVAMCVNDVLAVGAAPLFLLDYIGTSKVEPRVLRDVVRGVAAGCRQARCVLLGGETAELPGFYNRGEYDLAGFAVGVVGESRILGKEKVREGDLLIGLPSNGVHSNGFSLARKVLLNGGARALRRRVPGGEETVGEALLRPTRIYVPDVVPLLEHRSLGRSVHAACHVTGGGIVGNLPRVIPDGLQAQVRRSSWEVPPIFGLIRERGGVRKAEMDRVFNMGIGFVLIVARTAADRIVRSLARRGAPALRIGEVGRGPRKFRWT